MSLPIAILAGGQATRLQPITERIPKSLVEVAGRPFVEHQIELLAGRGVTDLVFLVGHLGDMLRDAIGDGRRWGVDVRYVFDGAKPLGTDGAIGRALSELGDEFMVLYGDSYLDCDYAAIEQTFRASGKNGLMTVYRNDDRFDTSNVVYAGGCIRRRQAELTPDMRHIDYGLGAFCGSACQLDYAAFDPRRCINVCWREAIWRVTRSRTGFSKSARCQARGNRSPPDGNWSMSYAKQHSAKRLAISGLDDGVLRRWRRCWRIAVARRPSVFLASAQGGELFYRLISERLPESRPIRRSTTCRS